MFQVKVVGQIGSFQRIVFHINVILLLMFEHEQPFDFTAGKGAKHILTIILNG